MPESLKDSAQSEYEQTLALFLSELAKHPVVLQFQAAEDRLKHSEELYALEVEMKSLAKDAVLYKKIGKERAYQEMIARSKMIESQLNDEPVLIDYRRKLTAANALLQYLLQNLEIQINEELHREN